MYLVARWNGLESMQVDFTHISGALVGIAENICSGGEVILYLYIASPAGRFQGLQILMR